MPGYSGHSWMEMNSTSLSPAKIASVPLPWCTSQSRISTRSSPCALVARRAATAALPKKQNPIACDGSAWCPGGRSAETPACAVPPSSPSTSAVAPPAARSAASKVAGTAAVSASRNPPPRAHSSSRAVTYGPGWIVSSRSRSTCGASSSAAPNQSWRPISASSARIRSGRSGCPGMSCSREASWRSQSGGTPVPYGLP